MWRVFPCRHCGADIAVQYLAPGEEAKCHSCGETTSVPRTAWETEKPPDAVQLKEELPSRSDDDVVKSLQQQFTCPRCSQVGTVTAGVCCVCGADFSGTALYNPKPFIWLALLFSFILPIYLAAVNWGRLGKTRLRLGWLIGGSLGFVLLFVLLAISEDQLGSGRLIGYVVNFPVAAYLRSQQLPLFRASLDRGMKKASLLKGSLVGIGLLTILLGVSLAIMVAILPDPLQAGLDLMEKGEYSEAAEFFERMHDEDPREPAILWNKAICELELGDFGGAGISLVAYLELEPEDPYGYVLLGFARESQGRFSDVDRLYSIAETMQPGAVNELLGVEWAPSNSTPDSGR